MAPAGYGDRVEGAHAVRAAVEAGRVVRLWVERGRADGLSDLLDLVPADRVTLVEDARLLASTAAPQGVVAECRPIHPLGLDELVARSDAVLVVDHVEDPQNLGAMVRTVGAAGIGGVVVSARRAAPLSAAAFKAAAGALERVPVSIVGSIPDALLRLKGLGMWVVGLTAGGETPLFGLDLLTEPVAVVVGAEGVGLSRLTAERCDVLASIPMATETDSLNVSVSTALACYEIVRVRRGFSP